MDTQEPSRSTEWAGHRDEILRLYGEEGWTLSEISKSMRDQHGLRKTDRQYKRLFQKNKITKNEKSTTWAFIHHQLQARNGKRSEVLLSGTKVPPERLERNIQRYSKVLSVCPASLNHVIIHTPPATPHGNSETNSVVRNNDNQNDTVLQGDEANTDQLVHTPWELIDFASEELPWEPISLPEEAMDLIDLSNTHNLAERVRQLNLEGIILFPTSQEGSSSIVGVLHASTRDLEWSNSQGIIPRGVEYSNIWSSLTGIVTQLAESHRDPAYLRSLHGHPGEVRMLQDYTKTNLLDFLITLVVNEEAELSFVYSQGITQLRFWLSHPCQRELLQFLLSFCRFPRMKAFTLGIVREYMGRGHNATHTGALVTCFEALLSLGERELASDVVTTLYRIAIRWPLPDLIRPLLERGANIEGFYTGSYSRADYLWAGCMQQPTVLRTPRVAALLLNHGASPTPGLTVAIDACIEASRLRDDTSKEDAALLSLLSHGADLDMITTDTMPLTIAERKISLIPALGELIQDWIRNAKSREIIKIYENDFDPTTLQASSPMAREVVLLAMARERPIDIVRVKGLLEHGTHPAVPSLSPKGEGTESMGKNLSYPVKFRGSSRPHIKVGTGEHRASFGFHEDVQRPIDLACAEWDVEATKTFLDAGASPPWYILQASSKESILGRSRSKPPLYKHWLQEPFLRIRARNFLREISEYLLGSAHMPSTVGFILQSAIILEDAKLLRELVKAGINLEQPMGFSFIEQHESIKIGNCTAFLASLVKCSLEFAQEVWRIDPRFSYVENQKLGAHELVGLCSVDSLACVDLPQKVSFVLSLGADPNAVSLLSDWYACSPLQATLHALYGCKNGTQYDFGGSSEDAWRFWQRQVLICEMLLNQGADIDAAGSSGPTPLQLATFYGDLHMVKRLLPSEPNTILARSIHFSFCPPINTMSSPLVMTCAQDRCFCDQTRRKKRTKPSSYPWRKHLNKTETARTLITAGANVNLVPSRGDTALMAACRRGCLPTVRLLLQCGADVNQPSKDICSPIEATCDMSANLVLGELIADATSCDVLDDPKVDIAFLLLDSGADVSNQGTLDSILWQALQARTRQHFKERLFYLQRSAALYYEATNGTMANLRGLVEAGADVNCRIWSPIKDGPTPLFGATASKNFSAVLYLIEKGADIHATTASGENAFCMAIDRDSYDIVQLLLNVGGRRMMEGDSFLRSLTDAKAKGSSVVSLLKQWADRENTQDSLVQMQGIEE